MRGRRRGGVLNAVKRGGVCRERGGLGRVEIIVKTALVLMVNPHLVFITTTRGSLTSDKLSCAQHEVRTVLN